MRRQQRHRKWVYSIAIATVLYSTIGSTVMTAADDDAPRPNSLSADELRDGWLLLFDGESLFGWKPATKADWSVVDGSIRVTKGEKGLLHTTAQFSDYELKVDFRAAAGTNSGIFLRTSPKPEDPTSGCYELNIADSQNPFPTGSFVGRQKAAFSVDDTDWHSYLISASGGQFNVHLDGRQVLDWQDAKPLGRGFIGLQLNEGQVEFRNIKLRPLGLDPMLNGKDLAGWKIFPDRQSTFEITKEGELQIKNGPGQLETDAQYGDFVLQTEVFVNGKQLNSGIFFRSIPGDYSNGYESQIHNGYEDKDRNRPNNGGTGGIFRRVSARRVVANDFEWFRKTIICEGRHMAVWVNGWQVTDWTDRRAEDPNPRRGLRLAKGTIILQGHDPTTDLLFRNMRIAEMATRR